jgi:hypothetical protein
MSVSTPKNGGALVRGSGSRLAHNRNRDDGMGGCDVAEVVTVEGRL